MCIIYQYLSKWMHLAFSFTSTSSIFSNIIHSRLETHSGLLFRIMMAEYMYGLYIAAIKYKSIYGNWKKNLHYTWVLLHLEHLVCLCKRVEIFLQTRAWPVTMFNFSCISFNSLSAHVTANLTRRLTGVSDRKIGG